MVRLTATEAARSFSDLLNRVAAGEEIAITRSGATVAVIAPPKARLLSAERYGELMRSAPPVDDEFTADLREIRTEIRAEEDTWPS